MILSRWLSVNANYLIFGRFLVALCRIDYPFRGGTSFPCLVLLGECAS